MNKNKPNKSKGIVVALKANFLIVEIDYKDFNQDLFDQSSRKVRLLCTRRSKLDYKGLFIDVGESETSVIDGLKEKGYKVKIFNRDFKKVTLIITSEQK